MTPRGATSWPERGTTFNQTGESCCEFAIAVVDDGRAESLESGRRALAHRARLNGAASTGAYTEEMEDDRATAGPPAHRRE